VKARQQIETLAGDGQRRAFTPALIVFIALPEAKDNIDPEPSRWSFCRGVVLSAATTRSSAIDSDFTGATTISAEPSGRGAVCRPCKKTFTILPDWLRTVRIRHAYPIDPLCADRRNIGCLACGA
jgi:hypothetical protein